MKRILIISSAVLLLAACMDKLTEGFNLSVDTDIQKYTAFVKVVDSQNPDLDLDNVSITLEGNNSSDIYDITGSKSLIIDKGRTAFGLHPEITIGETPINVTLFIEVPGYLSNRLTVTFSNTDTVQQYHTLSLVSKNNPPKGVETTSSTVGLTGNKTTQEEKISLTPSSGDKKTGMEITIQEETSFKNAEGQIISGGDLEISIANFDSENQESLDNYPGGLAADGVLLENGETEDIIFKSAGFTAIDMFVGEEKVKEFSKPVQVCMELDETTINPNTGLAIAVNDNIDIWSYEEEDGTWQYEKTGTVTEQNGKLCMVFDIEHLSYYNLDWKGSRCSFYPARSITFNSNYNGVAYLSFNSLYTASSNDYFYWTFKRVQVINGSITHHFFNTPSAGLHFKAYKSYSDLRNKINSIGQGTFYGCSNGSMNVVDPNPPTTVCVKGVGRCPGGNISIRPSGTIEFKKEGDSYFRYLGYLYNGQMCTSKLELGSKYKFRTYYKGVRESDWQLVDQTNYEFDVEIPAGSGICN